MLWCWLRDVLYALLAVAALPWLAYRRVAQGRYRSGWGQRFGGAPRVAGQGRRVWIHAVSVGEVNGIATLVEGLEEQGFEVVISTTTDTGRARAEAVYGGGHAVFYFPWDFSWAVRRAFGRLRPCLCVMMEGEVWPNFTAVAQRLGVPVVVANGRVGGDKGWPRYRRWAALVRPMFGRLSLVLAQDETAAQRFEYLGVATEQLQVVGSLKYDTAELVDEVAGTEELAGQLQLRADDLVWVAGSTGPGEEAMLLEVHERLRGEKGLARLRLVMVPRKPERFDEVAQLIARRGQSLLRYSEVKSGEGKPGPGSAEAVILGDTMGDLRKFYSLASAVFVGRSLVAMGGSDMMEAAALAKAVVVGPYTENFMASVQALAAGQGIEIVADGNQLGEVLGKLLKDAPAAEAMGRRAREVIQAHQGATQRSIEAIMKLLK